MAIRLNENKDIVEHIKKGLKDLSDEEKRTVGAFANEITEELESLLKTKHEAFYQKEMNE